MYNSENNRQPLRFDIKNAVDARVKQHYRMLSLSPCERNDKFLNLLQPLTRNSLKQKKPGTDVDLVMD